MLLYSKVNLFKIVNSNFLKGTRHIKKNYLKKLSEIIYYKNNVYKDTLVTIRLNDINKQSL